MIGSQCLQKGSSLSGQGRNELLGGSARRISDHKWHRVLKLAAPMEHSDGPSHVVGNIAERLTRPVRGYLSEWSRTTWALGRTGTPQERWLCGLLGITKESDLNTVIVRNNKIIYWKVWRQMARASSDKQGLALQGHDDVASHSQRDQWYEMARTSSHERELAPQGHDEVAMSGPVPPGMLPPENKSWHLGMSHPGTAGSGEAWRSWRGAGTAVSNMGQSSCFTYPRELKERHCQSCVAQWEAGWWVYRRPELVVWEISGGRCC